MGNQKPVRRATYTLVLSAESLTIPNMAFAKTKISLQSDTTFGQMFEMSHKGITHNKPLEEERT